MNIKIIDELAPGISELIKGKNAKIIREDYSESFGDIIIEIETQYFNIRVVRDRGRVTVGLKRANGDIWHDMVNILKFIQSKDTGVNLSLSDYERIAQTVKSKSEYLSFLEFEKEESLKYLEKIFPKEEV